MRGKVESLTIDVEGKQRMTFALSQDARRGEYEATKGQARFSHRVQAISQSGRSHANSSSGIFSVKWRFTITQPEP